MKFILGVVAGAIGYWLYTSRGRQSPTSTPEFLQHASQSVTSVVTAGAQRTVDAIDGAPLPQQVKDVASQVTTTVRAKSSRPSDAAISGAESAAPAGAPTPEGDLPPEAAAP